MLWNGVAFKRCKTRIQNTKSCAFGIYGIARSIARLYIHKRHIRNVTELIIRACVLLFGWNGNFLWGVWEKGKWMCESDREKNSSDAATDFREENNNNNKHVFLFAIRKCFWWFKIAKCTCMHDSLIWYTVSVCYLLPFFITVYFFAKWHHKHPTQVNSIHLARSNHVYIYNVMICSSTKCVQCKQHTNRMIHTNCNEKVLMKWQKFVIHWNIHLKDHLRYILQWLTIIRFGNNFYSLESGKITL